MAERIWYPTTEAYKLLDLGSYDQLLRLRRSGRLGKLGHHYRIVNLKDKRKRPTYQFHIGNCQEALNRWYR